MAESYKWYVVDATHRDKDGHLGADYRFSHNASAGALWEKEEDAEIEAKFLVSRTSGSPW